MRSPLFVVVLLVVCLAAASVHADKKGSKPRGKGKGGNKNASQAADARRADTLKRAEAQKAAAQRVLAAAQAKGGDAQSRLSAAMSGLTSARDALAKSRAQVRDLEKELREIEAELLDEQEDDSPYEKADAAFDEAKEKVATAEAKVLQSPEVRKRLESAGPANSEAAIKIRSSALNTDSGYGLAKEYLRNATSELTQIKKEIFQASPQWLATFEELQDARRDVADAERQATTSGLSKLGPTQNFRDAAKAAVVAQAALAQAESVIRSSQSQQKRAQNSQAKPPPKKR